LIAPTQTDEVKNAVLELFDSMVDADRKCTPMSSSDALLGFLRTIVSGQLAYCLVFGCLLIVLGILSFVESLPPTPPNKLVVIDGEDLASIISKITRGPAVSVPILKFPSTRQLLLALAHILKLISKHSHSPQSKIQFRKIFSRFRQFVEDNEDSITNGEQPEVCSHSRALQFITNRPSGAQP
jgi:hypothetical protein